MNQLRASQGSNSCRQWCAWRIPLASWREIPQSAVEPKTILGSDLDSWWEIGCITWVPTSKPGMIHPCLKKKRYGFSRGTQPQNQKKMRRTMPITFTPAELTHDAPQIYQRNEENQGCCHSGTTIGEYDLRGKNPIRVVHPIPKAQKIIKIGCTWYHIKIFGRCNMDGLDCRWCGKLPFTHGSETNIYICPVKHSIIGSVVSERTRGGISWVNGRMTPSHSIDPLLKPNPIRG